MFENDQDILNFMQSMATPEALAEDAFVAQVVWLNADGEPMLFMFPQLDSPDRSALRQSVASLSAAQEGIHSLAFLTDSYGSTSPTRLDGTPWGPGGMQEAVSSGSPDAVLVHEQVSLHLVTMDSLQVMGSLPYDRYPDGHVELRFADAMVMREGDAETKSLGGAIPDILQFGLQQPSIIEEAMETFPGTSREEMRVKTLVTMVAVNMSMSGYPCAFAFRGEEEVALFNKAIDELPAPVRNIMRMERA